MNDDDYAEREERAIYAIMAVVATPVLVAVGVQGLVIDSGATLCMLLGLIGVIGFVLGLRRARHPLPHARVHRRADHVLTSSRKR